ncbi:hypothetical protein X975_05011, partial [Stegodyphus mimosarum]
MMKMLRGHFCAPKNIVCATARQLKISRSMVHMVLHKQFHIYAYKVQLLQALLPTDKPKHVEFAIQLLHYINENEGFLKQVSFSDEATFTYFGQLNQYNVQIWEFRNLT